MNSNSAIKTAVRFALLSGAGAALAMPAVFAQDVAQSGQAANQTSGAVQQLGKVEVTGTRILRTNVETAQPITVITAQQIQQSGLTTIGDVLTNITQAGAALNTLFNNGGNGATEINLRYFGANRVLVLVNGRRWTPSLGGTIDLNNIPSSIVDHVEILQDGASAIYGSDAITGVVNIVTKKNFNGAEATAYMGIYHNNYDGFNSWDGKQQMYNFTIGTSGARSGVVMSASYTEQNPVWAGSRAISKEAIWTQGGGSSFSAGGRFILANHSLSKQQIGDANCSAATQKLNPKTGLMKLTSGSCDMALINTPTEDPSLANFRGFEDSDKYNFAPLNLFSTPLETKTIYMQGHYDIADNLTFTALGEANVRTSQTALAPAPLGFGQGGISLYNGGVFGIGANNPYNPFHEDLVAKSSLYCPSGHTLTKSGNNDLSTSCTPNKLLTLLGRRPIGGGLRISNQNVENFTYRMGLNGFFNAIGSEWDWDVGASYGNIFDNSISTGGFNTGRLSSALDTPGAAQCTGPGVGSATDAGATGPGGTIEVGGMYYPLLISGCVPANFFGGYNQSTGQGSLTPAMLTYVQYENHSITENTMRDYTGNITGDLFQLPAGPVAVALGGEYLEQDGFNHPDALAVAGNVDEGGGKPTDGRVSTDAEYVEINIPILADVPLAKALNIDLANRWSQFQWAGGEEGSTGFGVKHNANSTTGQAKLRWQVTTDLLLRGSWSQGFRVPSLNNLYGGAFFNFPVVTDPCAPSTANGGWNPATPLPTHCNGIQHKQLDAQIQTQSGGNPDLQPERAISRSAGFVYNPSWVPGFDISADYFKIDVGNLIGNNGAQYILNQCYLQGSPEFCSRIETAAGGSLITLIKNSNANTGEEYSRGVDVAAHYHFPATPIGNFTLGTNWTFEQSFVSVKASASSPSGWQSSENRGMITASGYSAIPQRKGSVSLDWNYGDWAARWFVQYIGPVYEGCSATTIGMGECSEPSATFTLNQNDTKGKNKLGTTIYHDVELTYQVEPINTSVTFGIRNLFNKQPPAALTAFANSFIPSQYRLPGRFFYVSIGAKF